MQVTDISASRPICPMQVLGAGVYRGPHLFSNVPMVRIELDLGSLENWPSDRIPGFTEHLLNLLPGLQRHGCCFQEPGGLVRRLQDGTWLGHVAEHVALELQTQAGSRATHGKTRSVRHRPGVYNVMYEYHDEVVGLLAGRLALQLVDILLPKELQGIRGLDQVYADEAEPALEAPFTMDAAGDLLERVLRRRTLGPTTRALVREAERRDIPVMRLDERGLIQLGQGRHQVRLSASITGRTSQIGCDIAGDKHLTKMLLQDAGLPAPRGALVRDVEDAVRAATRIGYPVVTKPLDGNHGRGVSIGLADAEGVRRGVAIAQAISRRVVVEQQFTGNDHRILVIGGEIAAVAERVPAHVIGDGIQTIAALIDAVNHDPRRGDGHEKVMTRISVDASVMEGLAKAGLTLESVPAAGQTVMLRATANMSTGGTAVDRTDEIHPDNAAIARRAAQIIGLDIAGIDLIAPDIAQSILDTGGGIVEVNAAPGFRMHLEPAEGRARNVARPTLDMLFPRGTPSRIPVFAVTGTNGKSTTGRMVAEILSRSGLRVGLTSTNGIYIGGERVAALDASGPKSARLVFRDPTVEAAVLETARGGILREGLGFDRCDIGAVLNVQEDHLGLKGVDTIEDLADVKAVVVEAVHRGGFSILNADDPLVSAMRRRAGGRVVYFSLNGTDLPERVREHIEDGGLAVIREPGRNGGTIVVHDDGDRLPLMSASEIPATLGGFAEFNVANALAAVAMTCAYGVPFGVIRSALCAFQSSFDQIPGRLNVHDGHGFRVILDYAHNPAGLRALGKVVSGLRAQHGRCIGMVNIPGDRRDEDIREMGRIAAGLFDEIVFREDPARRGRAKGEIVARLAEGALEAGFPRDHIRTILDEGAAAEACLRLAGPGDLVVLTPTEVEDMWRQVLAFRPERPARDAAAPSIETLAVIPDGAVPIKSAEVAHG